ncbi:alpha/beta fold hydrolase [Thiomonas sp.]
MQLRDTLVQFRNRALHFDEASLREIAARVFDRTLNIESSMMDHWILGGGGAPLRPHLDAIVAPTLVMHGTPDPLFPYGHAVALSKESPGAQLLPLEGMGHEMPPREIWGVVVPAILQHTSNR